MFHKVKTIFNPGERLTAAQMEGIQDQLVQAVDGYGGGTYTPNADLSIVNSSGNATYGTSTGQLTLSGGAAHIDILGPGVFIDAGTFGEIVLAGGDGVHLYNALTQHSVGRIRKKVKLLPTGANSVDICTFNELVYQDGYTGSLTLTASDSLDDGDWFRICNNQGTGAVSFTGPGSFSGSVPNTYTQTYAYLSGAWHIVGRETMGTNF